MALPTPKKPVRAKFSAKKLGDLLGIGERWVRQLEQQGVVVKNAYGDYDIPSSVQGYIRFKVESEIAASTDRGRGEKSDYDFERARKLKLQNDQTDNLLVPVQDAVAAVDAIFGAMRTALSGVPARVSDDVQVRRRLETEIDSVLTELADGYEQAGRALATGGDPLAADEKVNA